MKKILLCKVLLLLLSASQLFSQWSNTQNLTGTENSHERFGKAVSLSNDGSVLVVGVPRDGEIIDTNNNTTEKGAVRIYTKNNGTWVLQQQIDGVNDDEHFGNSVSITPNADFLIVGAPYDNDPTNAVTEKKGIARIYEKNNNGIWSQVGEDINGENNDEFSGHIVDISDDGNTVVIGGYGYSNNTGVTRIYKNEANTWTKSAEFFGINENDYTGFSVSISGDGNTVAFGAYGDNEFTGTTRIYNFNNNIWTQIGNDIDGEEIGENSGFSISLSETGTTVLIGAYDYDNRGAVRLYNFETNTWVKEIQINGEEGSFERFGYSVSLSPNALNFGVGESRTGIFSAGSASVYTKTDDTWIQKGESLARNIDFEQFGAVIGLSPDGNTFAVSSFSHNINQGIVNLYEFPDGSLSTNDHTFDEITYAIQDNSIVVNSKDINISIYDFLGRNVKNNNLNGAYIVNFIDVTNGKTQSKKIVIN